MRHAQLCISYYLSVRFRKLQFDDCRCASYTPSPDIIYHARLYALATRFLVESLREQCLASLHQDLRQLIDKTSDINLIIDLLNVTYSITGKSEPGGGLRFENWSVIMPPAKLRSWPSTLCFVSYWNRLVRSERIFS